jgi:hypothetical protein
MSAMDSGGLFGRLPAAGFEPVGGGERHGILGLHCRKAGEHVLEVFLAVDPEAPAVFHDGVEDGGFFTGLFAANEQPVARAELGRTDRIFYQVIVNFNAAVAKIDFEVGPLVECVADGLAELALGQDGAAD